MATVKRPTYGNKPAFDHDGRTAIPSRRRALRIARVTGAVLVVVCLAFLISSAGLYFLLRGEAVENSLVNRHVHASIQHLLGPDFTLEMGRTTIGFDAGGSLSLASADVQVRDARNNRVVSRLERVSVGIGPFSLLFGNPRIDVVTVENSSLHAAALSLPAGGRPPASIDEAISVFGQRMEAIRAQFAGRNFRRLEFRNVELTGLPEWFEASGALMIVELGLKRGPNAALHLDATLATEVSNLVVKGEYAPAELGQHVLKLDIDGLSLREWAESPETDTGPLGSDSVVRATAVVPIGGEHPSDPQITVAVSPGKLRVGRTGLTELKELELHLQLMRDRNQIELAPSRLVAGAFSARLVGGVKPVQENGGFGGDWRFELIADPALTSPTTVGEEPVRSSLLFNGHYRAAERLIDVERVELHAGDDLLFGSAKIGLTGQTPALATELWADSIEIPAFRQLWPFWIAPPVRRWIHQNAIGGVVSDFSLSANVPPGVIGRLRYGAKMKPDEFVLSMEFDDVDISTFGSLPAIRKSKGHFKMTGMKAQVTLDEGQVALPASEEADVTGGRFVVEDIAKRPNDAEIQVSLSGRARVLAQIADSEPLNAIRKLNVDPLKVGGDAHADVIVRVPLLPQIAPQDTDWHAIVNLENAESPDRIFGHTVSDADLSLEITPKSARISGNAVVDGTRTELEMTEPLGESKVAAARSFSAVLDNEARKNMGLRLDGIVDGDVAVSVDQIDQNLQQQNLDLRDAAITLPWIGWTKGKSIPAKASYTMRRKGDRTFLDDFYIEGEGFSAAGSMVLDKAGLVSADFADISLNEGDSFALNLSRKENTFDIEVAGARMDARGLINKLFHQGGFGDAQGKSNIVLNANLGLVRGFNGSAIRNVAIRYGTREGWFDSLSLRGAFTNQTYVNVFATTEDRRTTFEVDSNDAGAALGFIDVYRRMRGGNLRARLVRDSGGAFVGPVRATDFVVVDEPRLKRIISTPSANTAERGLPIAEVQRRLAEVNTQRVTFLEATADIEKGLNYFRVSDGVLNSAQIGFTFDGLLFDANNHMDLTGTFLPAMVISRAIGFIPLVGDLLGNGRDSGLIGITFRMRGPARNPMLEVNPVSVVAPGVFRKVFEYRN